MSWNSVQTSLPVEQRLLQTNVPEGSIAEDWATPAPLAPPKPRIRNKRQGKGHSSALGDITEASSSTLHEIRSLPVAQVTPSKAEQSPPRKTTHHNPPSTLHIRTHHSDYASLPASSYIPHEPSTNDKFVPLDATLSQTLIVPDVVKHKSPSRTHHYDADLETMTPNIAKMVSPSGLGGGHSHRHSPVKSDLYTYTAYSPKKDTHMGLSGKTSLDYDKPSLSTSTYLASLKSHDLTQWQQQLQQQQQQMQQQLERLHLSQPTVQPTYSYTGSYPTSLAVLPDVPHYGHDMGKLEGVIRAKDNLLEEKNLVIERQKLELAHIQEQMRQKQAQERQYMYSRMHDDKGDFLLMKVQEYQYENASLKAQFAENSSSKAAEIELLNKKLGETEYKHEQLKRALKETNESKVKEVKELKKKMSQLEEDDDGTKTKYGRLKDKYDKLKKRIGSLEQYMGDLPTAEQHLKNTEIIKSFCEKEKILKERILQLEASLSEARNTVRSRDITISKLESRESDLHIELDSLRKEASHMQFVLGAPKDSDPSGFKLFSRTAMEELVHERDEARTEIDKLKKMVESKHKQLKALQAQHQKSTATLEERLQQEEDTITALRETICCKDNDLRRMKESMDALAKQSQELYEHNVNVQERNQTLEKIASSNVMQTSHQLIQELGDCVGELHGLVQVCTQTAEGQEPNVSVLLRFRAPSMSSHDVEGAEGDSLSSDKLKARLKQVTELRAEIDRLRSLVSNKYAEDMGNECITQ